jgi:hypothetical protein
VRRGREVLNFEGDIEDSGFLKGRIGAMEGIMKKEGKKWNSECDDAEKKEWKRTE